MNVVRSYPNSPNVGLFESGVRISAGYGLLAAVFALQGTAI